MKRLLFVSCMFVLFAGPALAADPLPLTDAQIQKLRTYLPSDDESTPLVWKGESLSIMLPLHAEKRLVFPEPIEANLNSALNNDQLRIINNDQSLYLTALKLFGVTRMYVTLKNSNKIILLDVSTSDTASSTMRTIKIAATNRVNSIRSHNRADHTERNAPDALGGSANDYVNAIRFAWQQLYAPQRLLNKNTDFARTPMHTTRWVSDLIYGDKVLAHPEVSWIAGDLYVTAIELRNKYPHVTTLNLQHDLCGEWQAATLYPRTHLKPAGNKTGDSTILFLISSRPFGDMLEVCHGGA
jgi:integrating conjugative element protein (TIGR03749 family)